MLLGAGYRTSEAGLPEARLETTFARLQNNQRVVRSCTSRNLESIDEAYWLPIPTKYYLGTYHL